MTDARDPNDLLAEAGLIADDILHGGHDPRFVSPQIRNLAVAYQSLAARVRALETEIESLRGFKRGVDEALNSGDGSYRP